MALPERPSIGAAALPERPLIGAAALPERPSIGAAALPERPSIGAFVVLWETIPTSSSHLVLGHDFAMSANAATHDFNSTTEATNMQVNIDDSGSFAGILGPGGQVVEFASDAAATQLADTDFSSLDVGNSSGHNSNALGGEVVTPQLNEPMELSDIPLNLESAAALGPDMLDGEGAASFDDNSTLFAGIEHLPLPLDGLAVPVTDALGGTDAALAPNDGPTLLDGINHAPANFEGWGDLMTNALNGEVAAPAFNGNFPLLDGIHDAPLNFESWDDLISHALDGVTAAPAFNGNFPLLDGVNFGPVGFEGWGSLSPDALNGEGAGPAFNGNLSQLDDIESQPFNFAALADPIPHALDAQGITNGAAGTAVPQQQPTAPPNGFAHLAQLHFVSAGRLEERLHTVVANAFSEFNTITADFINATTNHPEQTHSALLAAATRLLACHGDVAGAMNAHRESLLDALLSSALAQGPVAHGLGDVPQGNEGSIAGGGESEDTDSAAVGSGAVEGME
ncbi:unnamed protein product [Peniophora sp. CBMAI 1063]|nr:unnamed protein product [Peniophora sp. CBMAI 1063]